MSDTVQIQALREHQEPIAASPARHKVVRAGRRFGKDRLALNVSVLGHGPNGMHRGLTQGYDVVWVAPDYPQSKLIWVEEIRPRFRGLSSVKLNEADHTLTLPNGATLWLRSAEVIDGIRGIGKRLGGVIVNEAAHLDLEYAHRAVIMPALTDNRGWTLYMSTTNSGEDGNTEKRIPSYFNLLCEEIQLGKRSSEWAEFYGTAFDNPVLDRIAVEGMVAEYDPDSIALKQEVYAQLVEPGAADQVIKREWAMAATSRHQVEWFRDGEWAIGVDPAASHAGDKGALAFWRGACLVELRAFPCPDVNKLGEDVHSEVMKYGVAAERVGVDSVGVGAGTVSTLYAYGLHHIRALNGGSRPMNGGPEKFANLRAEMYWKMREDLRLNRVALPNDQELISQLTIPRYEIRNGVIYIESKEDIKKRMGGRSPDKADAVVYGNYVRAPHDPKPKEPVDRINRHPGYEESGGKTRVRDDSGKPKPQWAPGPRVPSYRLPREYQEA